MGKKMKECNIFQESVYQAVLKKVVDAALTGDVTAMRTFLAEYHVHGAADAIGINSNVIAIAQLINNPVPDMSIDDVLSGGEQHDD